MTLSQRRNRRPAKKRPSTTTAAPRLPLGEHLAHIRTLLSDGRGLATVDDKPVMIAGALPEETVRFRYTKQTRQFLEGEAVDIIEASPARVKPQCLIFGHCGGCVLQHLDATKQIDFKHQQLLDGIQRSLNKPPKEIAAPLIAAHWHYRHRARVALKWHAKDKRIELGFRGRGSSQIVPASSCETLAEGLSALLPALSQVLSQLQKPEYLTHVEMTLAETPEEKPQIALTFAHIKPLPDSDKQTLVAWAQCQHALPYLQSGEQNAVTGLNHTEKLSYYLQFADKPRLQMNFMPSHFTQVNFAMNRKMVAQALEWLDLQADDCVLDLFCGLGNFTLPIAQQVRQVVGVEGSSALVNWAKDNAEINGITNAAFHQADLTQNTQMMAWRVKHRYNKVLIDPPRAGAIDILPLLQSVKPERICYVSCHGATLARDLKVLVNDYGYRLEKLGAMDMFAQTAHVEAMALLVKP